MKKIIAGQLMMWTNLTFVVIGYIIFTKIGIESEFVSGLLAFLGTTGSIFNLITAITLQVRGYMDEKIVFDDPKGTSPLR